MFFGVDYYPEQWPKARWDTDAKMMRAAGMNVVRIAEFAWSRMEPVKGQYDFTWLDEIIAVMAEQDIRVVLGTPTATPPKWLMDENPDIYPVDLYGIQKGFGTRRHYCSVNPVYRELSKRIAGEMAEHFKYDKNIIAWQVDNEFDTGCYCSHCRKGFQNWLREKYQTIEHLNEHWGTVFWSQTYQDFEQVILPAYTAFDGFTQGGAVNGIAGAPFNHNPGLLLDYNRFKSDAVVEFQNIQIREIRQCTSLPITHNCMGHFSELDYFDLGKDLDFISWDSYPSSAWGKGTSTQLAMAHDLMRGIKGKNFWVMEHQSGPVGWQTFGDTPEPGQLRLWTYQALAHGAEAMLYFRWRSALYGTEQLCHGIIDHDGIGRRRYEEIARIGKELKQLGELFVDSNTINEAVLIKSYDNFWSHRIQPYNSQFDYNVLLMEYYHALAANQIPADVTGIDVDFSSYRLVLMPAFNLMTDEIRSKCEKYVKEGGSLLITFKSGTKNWDNGMSERTKPGYFRELAGIELEEYDSLNYGRKVRVRGLDYECLARSFCEVIQCNGASVLASYESHYYAGKAAVTVNQYGKGRVYYVGCDLEPDALTALMKHIVKESRVTPILTAAAEGIDAVRKSISDKTYIIITNHNNREERVEFEKSYYDLLGERMLHGQETIEAYGVRILEEIL